MDRDQAGTKLLSEYDRPSGKHYEILLMSWAGWVFDFYDLILYTFLLIFIGREFHLSNITLAYLLGASLAATAAGGILFGILSDRMGRKKVLQLTIITYSLGTLLSGFAPTFALLLLSRIITGFGVGGEWATGQTYIGETFPPKVRGRYGAIMQTGAPVGIMLAALVGGLLAPVIGWRACFILSALPALMVIWIRRKLPESDLWVERKRLLQKKPALAEELKGIFLQLFSTQHRGLFFKSLVLTIFGLSAYWFTYSWMPGYLSQERHLSITQSALWVIVTQAGGFLGYITFGMFADRFGRRPAYTVYSVIMALGLAMITVWWGLVAQYPPVILSFMFLVGFGTGFFSGFGPLFSELFPTGIRNTAMGTAFNLARGVQFFTPVIIALVASRWGLSGGIFIAAFFALAVGAWIWIFPETKGKKLEVTAESSLPSD